MAKLSGSEIKQKAIDIIKQHPEGIGPTKLRDIIIGRHPDTKDGTIRGAVWKLDQDFPGVVGKGPSGYYIKGNGKPAAAQKAPKAAPATKDCPKCGGKGCPSCEWEGQVKANPKKAAPAKHEKTPAKRATPAKRDQDAEMQGLRAKLAKVQKAVCG